MSSEQSTPNGLMTGKTCLVTGATAGIGLVTARELARMGADVIIAGRSKDKCSATVASIREEAQNPAVEYLVGDLSSHQGVRDVADVVKDRRQKLDVLINNAGALMFTRQTSADGIEMTFALNHLAYYHLTSLLLGHLLAAESARVVNVASSAHKEAQLRLDDIHDPKRYVGFRAYSRSKLCNVLFTYGLARRLAETKITVNALHPGLVSTNFMVNNGFFGRAANFLLKFRGISVEQGAETPIYLASSPEVEGITGRYFVKKRETPSSKSSYNEEAAARLWEISAALTGVSEVEATPAATSS